MLKYLALLLNIAFFVLDQLSFYAAANYWLAIWYCSFILGRQTYLSDMQEFFKW